MMKSQYFCDRCGREVTDRGGQYALYPVRVARAENNPLKRDVCAACADEIAAVFAKLLEIER